MRVKRGRARLSGLVAAAAVLGLAFGGCASGKAGPTIVVIEWTPPPPTPSSTPTPVPTPSSDVSAAATPSVPATDAGPGPTAPPPAAPVSYTTCTVRGALDQAFWSKAAHAATTYDVYCPVLSSGWLVREGTYQGGAAGQVDMSWKGPDGAILEITEGSFCTTDADTCSPHVSVVGPVTLGDRLGLLDVLSGGGLAVYVSPGTAKAYTVTGSGISQAAFISIAAELVKVAKP